MVWADSSDRGSEPLATVTHARLRAAQGDLASARRLLSELLARSPDHEPARALLQHLTTPRDRRPAMAPNRQRILRLERWLTQIVR